MVSKSSKNKYNNNQLHNKAISTHLNQQIKLLSQEKLPRNSSQNHLLKKSQSRFRNHSHLNNQQRIKHLKIFLI